ncbi:MAG TPA: RIP metalloprotease RseP [Thermoanaerobaculia bacterium]|nr:RIP metalloprotease RseP [Thermoanaerobaculia bacterium]
MTQNIGTNILAVVIVLGFLIFIHEAGHFLLAKLFRVRVLVFSFGFGKRLFGFRKGSTDYRVSLVPLGGYVRMAGDNPEENLAGNPDEFLSKPKWQRFLILFAGPAMNIVIALLFMSFVAMIGFEERITKPIVAQVEKGTPAEKSGLQPGDRLLRIKNEPVNDYSDARLLISMNAGTPLPVVYERNGVQQTTTLTPAKEEGDFGPVGRAGILFATDPVIGRVEPNSPAALAGLRSGDRIVSANGKRTNSLEEFAILSDQQKAKPVAMEIARGSQIVRVTVAPSTDPDLNVSRGIVQQTKVTKLGFIPALRYSVAENWKMLRLTGGAVRRLFRPEGSVKELSGPINIARISGETLRQGGLRGMLGLMAMISLQLGIMNLLPIPVLDGGHIMILLIEGIARRDLSLRVKERIQQFGFAVLATLMIVVLYNDVISNVLRMRNG